MQDFFDRFKPKKQQEKGSVARNNNTTTNNNVFGNLLNGLSGGGGTKTFTGEGKSLGGSSQPGKVISIELHEPGPLGMSVEKRPGSGTAIVASVLPNSQADRAGIKRGDILCFSGSNGKEEILHSMFVELAKASDQRPLCFEVRRIETNATKAATAASTATSMTAEAYARKQAMVAAAESREKKFKQATKPVKTGFVPKSTTGNASSTGEYETTDINHQKPLSEASKNAMQLAKEKEMETAMQLGYNPYEVNTLTAGQARNAVATTSYGTLQNHSSTPTTNPSTVAATIPSVSTPHDPGQQLLQVHQSPPPEFEHAFETMITANDNDNNKIRHGMSVLVKLITNATTKTDAKFRKIRLENPKIKESIIDLHGALEIMLLVGFQLTTDAENENESVLVYNKPEECVKLSWVSTAIEQMESYCSSYSTAM